MKNILLFLMIAIGLCFGKPELVDGYYQIGTKEDLEWFRDSVNSKNQAISLNAKLTADIDLENEIWIPIAAGTGSIKYSGIFDGAGHTISNFVINGDSIGLKNKVYKQNLGFVGVLDGTVKNLVISNILVENFTTGGTVPNATGDKEKKAICVGTVAGWMSATGKIDSVSVTGLVNGFGDGQAVGGVVGNTWGKITHSSSEVTITVRNLSFVGGIVGMTKNTVTIEHVLWKGNIVEDTTVAPGTNTTYIGGIIGDIYEGTANVADAEFISDNVTNSVGRCRPGAKLNADKLDYGVYSIAFEGKKRIFIIDGDYIKPMSNTIFDSTFTVDSIVFNRNFTKNVYSTLAFPVTVPVAKFHGITFFELVDVVKDSLGNWEVHLDTLRNEFVNAGVPYIVIASEKQFTVDASTYTVEPVTEKKILSSTSQWSLNSYNKMFISGTEFGEDLENLFAFSGIAAEGFDVGQFVKCGPRVRFKPFRVYLHKETVRTLLKAKILARPEEVDTDTVDIIPIIITPREPQIMQDTVSTEQEPITIAPIEEPMAIIKKSNVIMKKHDQVRYFNILGRQISKPRIR